LGFRIPSGGTPLDDHATDAEKPANNFEVVKRATLHLESSFGGELVKGLTL
jgi:hypothetical protein